MLTAVRSGNKKIIVIPVWKEEMNSAWWFWGTVAVLYWIILLNMYYDLNTIQFWYQYNDRFPRPLSVSLQSLNVILPRYIQIQYTLKSASLFLQICCSRWSQQSVRLFSYAHSFCNRSNRRYVTSQSDDRNKPEKTIPILFTFNYLKVGEGLRSWGRLWYGHGLRCHIDLWYI